MIVMSRLDDGCYRCWRILRPLSNVLLQPVNMVEHIRVNTFQSTTVKGFKFVGELVLNSVYLVDSVEDWL